MLADSRARSDDPSVAQRRTAQQAQLREGTAVEVLAKETVEGLLSSGSMTRTDLVEYVHALAAGADAEGWIGALEAMKDRPDSMLLLRQADVRALVIVGELDRVTPIAEAMSLRSLLKGELVVVPNVGHLPNVEDPMAFNEALLSFVGVEAAPRLPTARRRRRRGRRRRGAHRGTRHRRRVGALRPSGVDEVTRPSRHGMSVRPPWWVRSTRVCGFSGELDLAPRGGRCRSPSPR